MNNNNSDAPVLIHFNESEYNRSKVTTDNALASVQQVVDQYKGLNLPPLEKGELGKLFLAPEEVIFHKMTGGQGVSIAGLEVHAHKAMEILKKPVGYDNLIFLIGEAKESFKKTGKFTHFQVEDWVVLDDEGTVSVNPEKEEKWKSLHRSYATSKTAKGAFTLANSILSQVEELGLSHVANTHREGFGGFLHDLFDMIGSPRKPIISTRAIVNYNDK